MHRQLDKGTQRVQQTKIHTSFNVKTCDCLTVSVFQGLVFQKHCSFMKIFICQNGSDDNGFDEDAVSDEPGPECCHATLNPVLHVTNSEFLSLITGTSNYSRQTRNTADGIRRRLSIHSSVL